MLKMMDKIILKVLGFKKCLSLSIPVILIISTVVMEIIMCSENVSNVVNWADLSLSCQKT